MKEFGKRMIVVLLLSLVYVPGIIAQNSSVNVSSIKGDSIDNEINESEVAEIQQEINASMEESASGWKIFWKKVGIWFTFNQEAKAKKELDLARLMLIRARIAAKNNNTKAMESAIQSHNRIIERVQKRLNYLSEGSERIETIKRTADKFVGLKRAIEVHEARIAKLNEMLENENLSDEQREVIENKIAKAENVTSKLKRLEEKKEEGIKTKLMTRGNMTEEEAEKIIKKFEEKHKIRSVRRVASRIKVAQDEKMIARMKKKIAKAEAEGKNVSKIKERLEKVESRIEKAKSLHESKEFSGLKKREKK